jgi:serine/threonine protein phosphatase 1
MFNMANSKTGVQSALRSRLKSIGRSASALRARIEQGFRRQPANDDYQDTARGPQGPVARKAMAPDGVCIYAIGDIHGRRDLLERLVHLIEEDAATLPEGVKPQIVFLGDYIDRGLQSRDVIDFFTSGAADKFDPVYLMGNHEEALLRFTREASFGSQWARYGGAETL